ncbi:antitoxin HicB [Schaalia sp. ZJ405]|uniref:antitoxin HicB n=1 Tax=Schaalia sp. ZJ405 TaxID=2709403 RepID=UPI0013ECAFC8|nr:antitoxin HicB [Schaalia sp. ZJ405]QPK80776.1 antitoxin HicB [Schaalia sp. ZJ405]
MTNLTITAKKWDSPLGGGWELWNGDDCWTQVKRLAKARQQVVDYLDTVEENVDHSGWEITIVPEIPGIDEVRRAQEASEAAARAQVEAAARVREAVRALRASGVTTTDAAWLMNVSRARVSQLANS